MSRSARHGSIAIAMANAIARATATSTLPAIAIALATAACGGERVEPPPAMPAAETTAMASAMPAPSSATASDDDAGVVGVYIATSAMPSASPPPASPSPSTSPSPSPSTPFALATQPPDARAYADAIAKARAARTRAVAMKPPLYRGPGTRDSVVEHLKTTFTPWFQAKKRVLDEAEASYVAAFRAGTPPQQVEAASEYATLAYDFTDEIYRVPIPKEWAKDSELRAAYYQAIDDAMAPMRDRVRAVVRSCIAIATRESVTLPSAQRCRDIESKLAR